MFVYSPVTQYFFKRMNINSVVYKKCSVCHMMKNDCAKSIAVTFTLILIELLYMLLALCDLLMWNILYVLFFTLLIKQ